ncbi:hypothetical protein, partial [Roseicella frigidaeris]|uniref:hypothetical protein n=1 Tax=Roseicella frigidaeris TaxID=2230885 RepID=UPI001A9E02E4
MLVELYRAQDGETALRPVSCQRHECFLHAERPNGRCRSRREARLSARRGAAKPSNCLLYECGVLGWGVGFVVADECVGEDDELSH